MRDGSLGQMKLGRRVSTPHIPRLSGGIGIIHSHPSASPEPSAEDKVSCLQGFSPRFQVEGYEPRLYVITSGMTNTTTVYIFPPKDVFSVYALTLLKIPSREVIAVTKHPFDDWVAKLLQGFDKLVKDGVIKKYEFRNTLKEWCIEI